MKAISLLLLAMTGCASQQEKYHPIRTPLNKKQPQFRQCYLESDSYTKTRESNTKGVVTLIFQVDTEGAVNNARIEKSDYKDPNFNVCVLGIIRGIKFGPQQAPIEVKETIDFLPRFDS